MVYTTQNLLGSKAGLQTIMKYIKCNGKLYFAGQDGVEQRGRDGTHETDKI